MEKLSADLQQRCDVLAENYKVIMQNIAQAAERSGRRPQDITLLAATKTVPVEVINYGIALGIHTIGENKVQELLSKYDSLHLSECASHFIGHLQTNKVKQIMDKVSMIHSVDSVKLATEVGRFSVLRGQAMDVLIEVNIGREENKSGIFPEQLDEFIAEIAPIKGIRVRGLMAIPPICEKTSEIQAYFSHMHKLFIDRRDKKIDNVSMDCLSMGMSSDYVQAVLEGANIVRIGSALFGSRNYNKNS